MSGRLNFTEFALSPLRQKKGKNRKKDPLREIDLPFFFPSSSQSSRECFFPYPSTSSCSSYESLQPRVFLYIKKTSSQSEISRGIFLSPPLLKSHSSFSRDGEKSFETINASFLRSVVSLTWPGTADPSVLLLLILWFFFSFSCLQ